MVGRFSAFDVLERRPHVAARVPECNFCASYADVRDVTGWQPALRPMFTPQRRAVRAPQGRHVGLAFWEACSLTHRALRNLGMTSRWFVILTETLRAAMGQTSLR